MSVNVGNLRYLDGNASREFFNSAENPAASPLARPIFCSNVVSVVPIMLQKCMWRGLAELARGVGQLIFPNGCLICEQLEGDRTDFRHGLCSACLAAVTTDPHEACPWCAATVGPHTDTSKGCPACREVAHGFDAAIRLGVYEGRLRDGILRMKSQGGEAVAEMLGRVCGDVRGVRLRAVGADFVVPVPLHWRRHFSRGHNQAAGIGRELAAGLGIQFATDLQRIRYTPQQAQPSAAARRENVKGAFRVRRGARLAGRTILLIDDVMTTGSTVSEAARTLKASGASQVVVVVLARR
ncbi:MAG: ComF family protein [Gemmataceae bacterium]